MFTVVDNLLLLSQKIFARNGAIVEFFASRYTVCSLLALLDPGLGSKREGFPHQLLKMPVIVVGDGTTLDEANCGLVEISNMSVVLTFLVCELNALGELRSFNCNNNSMDFARASKI